MEARVRVPPASIPIINFIALLLLRLPKYALAPAYRKVLRAGPEDNVTRPALTLGRPAEVDD